MLEYDKIGVNQKRWFLVVKLGFYKGRILISQLKTNLMKKLINVLILIMGIQFSYGQTGGWFKLTNPEKGFSIQDLSMIAGDIEAGRIVSGEWYNLPSGGRVMVLYPQEWFNLVLESYQETDNTVTRENLASTIAGDQIVSWNDDMAFSVKNYSHETDQITFKVCEGSQFLKMGVRAVVHKQTSPKIKATCGNPLKMGTQNQISNQNVTTDGRGNVTVINNISINNSQSQNQNQSSPTVSLTPEVIQPEYGNRIVSCSTGGYYNSGRIIPPPIIHGRNNYNNYNNYSNYNNRSNYTPPPTNNTPQHGYGSGSNNTNNGNGNGSKSRSN